MRKKRTPGEQIARKLWADGAITTIDVELWLWRRIDAAIRRAQAQAWDEGQLAGWEDTHDPNPYRKAER